MLELLMTHCHVLIAAPIGLFILQKTEPYQYLKQLLIKATHCGHNVINYIINLIKGDLSYRTPSKRQQKPIKEASKIIGWILITLLVLFCAWVFLFGTSILLLSALKDEPTVFTMGLLFFALCIAIAHWIASCAHKAAWQNGINIIIKNRINAV